MAITVAEIVAKIRADGADQVVSEFKRADDATSSLTSRIGALGPKMVSAGQKATLGMTLPIAGMAVGFVMAASDLNEATTAATTTYGAAAEQIVAWSQNSAQAVGLSSQQYLAAATQLGVFGNAAGLTGSDLASFGNDTIKAAADLASFYNVPVPEALDAIRAGLTGETEGLRRFGIMMNDATIQAYAMENGIWDGTGAMTEQQKILARQGFIMESMGAATGDFANTSDGLANQMRILKAELTNVAASMGQHLLPIVIKGVSFVRKLVDIFGGLSPSVQKVILIFMALAAAIGPVLVVAGTLIGAVTSIAAAFGAGGLLAPLLAVLGPIALVVGALALLGVAYKTNFLGFGDAVRAVAGWVADGFSRIMGFVGTLIDVFKGFAGPSDKVSDGFRKIGLALTLAKFDSLPGPIRMIARGLVFAAAAIGKFVSRLLAAGKKIFSAINDIKDAFGEGGLMGGLKAVFGDAGRKLLAGFGDALSALPKMVGEFLMNFKTGFAPLDAVIKNLGRVFRDVGRLIQEVFQGDFSGALEVGKRLLNNFVDFAISYFTLIPQTLIALFGAIDWAALWSGLQSAASTVFGALGGLAATGLTALWDAFTGIDWGGIWDTLITTVSGLGADLLTAASEAGTWLVDVGEDLLQGVLDGWDEIKPTLLQYASGLAGWVLEQITDAPGKLLEIGKALLQSVLDGWDNIKPTLLQYASGLPQWIIDQVPDAGDALLGLGKAFIQSVADGWDEISDRVSERASGIVDWIIGLVPDVGDGLKSVGRAFIGSVADGWDAVSERVSTRAKGLIDWVVGLVPEVGDGLKAIGEGLLTTFTTGWDLARGALELAVKAVTGVVDGFITAAEKGINLAKDLAGMIGIGGGGGGDEGGADPLAAIDAATALEDAKGRIETAVGAISLSLIALRKDFDNTNTTITLVISAINRALDTFVTDSGTRATDAGNGFNEKIYNGLYAGQVTTDLVLNAIRTALDTFVLSVEARATNAGNLFNTSIYTGLLAGQLTVDLVLAAIGTALGSFVTNVAALAGAAGDRFNTSIYPGLLNGQNTAKAVFDQIGTDAGSWVTNMGGLATGGGNVFATNSAVGFTRASTNFNTAAGAIQNRAGSLVSQLNSAGSQAGTSFANGIRQGAQTAVSAMQTGVNQIRAAANIGSLYSSGYRVGQSLGQGIEAGIRSTVSAIAQTAASAVNQAEQAARDAADARSPSRVFARLGVDMGAGVIVGLRDMVQPLVRQTADLATASIDTFARYQFDPMFASIGGGTSYSQPVPVASNRLNGNAGGGGNTFVVMTRSELADMFEAADVVKVLTTPEEITAAWGR